MTRKVFQGRIECSLESLVLWLTKQTSANHFLGKGTLLRVILWPVLGSEIHLSCELSRQNFQSLTGVVKRQLSVSPRGRTSKPHLWRCFFIMSWKIIKWLNICQMNVYSSFFAFWNAAFEALNFYCQLAKKWTWTHFLALDCSIISFLGPTHLILWIPTLPLGCGRLGKNNFVLPRTYSGVTQSGK